MAFESKLNIDAPSYEEDFSQRQNLSSKETKAFFEQQKIHFNSNVFIPLGLKSIHDDQFTNLGLLLSDQCPYTTKIAVFSDEAKTIFKDTREFSGSLFKQLQDGYTYLSLYNKTSATIHGLQRIEKKDYPEEAIREAFINALIHREYSYRGSIIINVNDSCMEFISLGGLVQDLSQEDLLTGISLSRNNKLTAIFHRLKLIESYGTGLRRIFDYYKDSLTKPRIETTKNTFKLILPNMNAKNEVASSTSLARSTKKDKLTPQMKEILMYLAEYQEMAESDIRNLLQIKKTRAYLLAREMQENGLITSTGRGVTKRYRLPN